jgi:hypothetical protein
MSIWEPRNRGLSPSIGCVQVGPLTRRDKLVMLQFTNTANLDPSWALFIWACLTWRFSVPWKRHLFTLRLELLERRPSPCGLHNFRSAHVTYGVPLRRFSLLSTLTPGRAKGAKTVPILHVGSSLGALRTLWEFCDHRGLQLRCRYVLPPGSQFCSFSG